MKTVITLNDEGRMTSIAGVAKAGELQRRTAQQNVESGRRKAASQPNPDSSTSSRITIKEIDEVFK